jgi:hypothetical protein
MPPREIRVVYIPPDRYTKLAAKEITSAEVREAIRNATDVRRGPKSRIGQTGRCYFVEASTDAGRPLKVLLRRYESGVARVITAWVPRR